MTQNSIAPCAADMIFAVRHVLHGRVPADEAPQ
jgi:hypothetical protein